VRLVLDMPFYADDVDDSIWDWSKKKKVVTFNNGNPAGSAITGVHFINEDAQTMILTASGGSSSIPALHILILPQPRELCEYSATTTSSGRTIRWRWSHPGEH
jgi:hypothetical protein